MTFTRTDGEVKSFLVDLQGPKIEAAIDNKAEEKVFKAFGQSREAENKAIIEERN